MLTLIRHTLWFIERSRDALRENKTSLLFYGMQCWSFFFAFIINVEFYWCTQTHMAICCKYQEELRFKEKLESYTYWENMVKHIVVEGLGTTWLGTYLLGSQMKNLIFGGFHSVKIT